MTKRPALPPSLSAELLSRARAGENDAQIAAWLRRNGVPAAARDVRRFILDLATVDRLELDREHVAEILAPTVASDLRELAELRRRARDYERNAAEAGDTVTALRALGEQTRALGTSLRALQPPSAQFVKAELDATLDKLQKALPPADFERVLSALAGEPEGQTTSPPTTPTGSGGDDYKEH